MGNVGAMAPTSFLRMHLAPMKSRTLSTLAPGTSLKGTHEIFQIVTLDWHPRPQIPNKPSDSHPFIDILLMFTLNLTVFSYHS